MKTKRVYIAGKITGEHTADVWYKFYLCECELKDAGYKVVNPLRLCESHWNWWRCMSVC
ncbi:MAG: DUF4406 domain-containing protein, partial [Bacteroidales bacterium]|nr:DUF4406 domain-containing protein [Bacteroidales bacterium]